MPSLTSASPAADDPLIVDRYAIYPEFAAGGMATVHFARLLGAQGFRRTVAAKRLLSHLTSDRAFAMMLVDEARMAARIRHPNVVATLDVVQTPRELVLVMDYVHGESLAKLMAAAYELGELIPLPVATAIVIDALHGLHAAHEARDEAGAPLNIVHRDVSPQNLLVGVDGITRIADFGIAKAVGRSHTTRSGTIKGKLSYMAPEQLEGRQLTRTADVFGMAVVLWELLTGARLFDGESQGEVVFKVLAAPIAPPSAHHPALPLVFDQIVARGLARDPAVRFPTAREMALALEQCAPTVRPSEIGAWVERVGGSVLRERACLLAEIEHAPSTTAPLRPSGTRDASIVPVSQAMPNHRRRGARFAVIAALAGILALAALGLASLTRERAAPTAARPRLPTVPLAVIDAGAAAPVVAPSSDQADELALPAHDAAIAPAVDAGAGRPRPARKSRKPACDPPYSVDATGRILFKVECM